MKCDYCGRKPFYLFSAFGNNFCSDECKEMYIEEMIYSNSEEELQDLDLDLDLDEWR